MYYSFIVPVYNRPLEIDELLHSLTQQNFKGEFEVVIVEDGSKISSEEVVKKYAEKLDISYYYKANSGPGDSRNYGMQKAKGDYFIILDSDCIIPENYLEEVQGYLQQKYVDCFGGPDAALSSFSNVQKAINFSMTSILTTGGIRGASQRIGKFQPRSFNMGISKKAFLRSNGFGKIHPGEDPDLAIRLWNLGFESELFPKAFVYHKRRIDWSKFYIQVNKFGKARPILNKRYPLYDKITYWFPLVFTFGLICSLFSMFLGFYFPILCYVLYLLLIFISASIKEKNLGIGFLAVLATLVQFYGYAKGFAIGYYKIFILKKKPEIAMPEMFFK
ncbi:glycosyltransferase family 2 protein [Myroides sp. LJL116]